MHAWTSPDWLQLLLLLPLLLLLRCPLPEAADSGAGVTSRPCTAHWAMLSSQRNRPGGGDFQVRLGFTSGPKDPAADTAGTAAGLDAGQDGDGRDRRMTPTGLTVRLASHAGASETELTVQLTGPALARPVERSLAVTVPERGSVTVWQLVATTAAGDGAGDEARRFGFENTAVTSGGLEPPTRVVACTAGYRTRPLIREGAPVRLRHAPTGKYLVMTRKRGWEAATLGYSREYRYRIGGVGVGGGSVRIEAETHTYGGYKFAYASLLGGVYFDILKPESESQQWTLSNPYPRDGDSVTIRSLRWPAAALTYNKRDSTASVYCLYTQNPDRWIIELA